MKAVDKARAMYDTAEKYIGEYTEYWEGTKYVPQPAGFFTFARLTNCFTDVLNAWNIEGYLGRRGNTYDVLEYSLYMVESCAQLVEFNNKIDFFHVWLYDSIEFVTGVRLSE